MTPYELSDATWPAVRLHRVGPWDLREGQGGGNRVSALTMRDEGWDLADIALAKAAQAKLGQPALFMVREGEERLDQALADRGYRVFEPVAIYSAAVAELAAEGPPPLTAFCIWPRLQILDQIWAEGGINPARLAIMDRAGGPKTAILGRQNDRAAAAAFVAAAGNATMLHALHIVPEQRRQGIAVKIMRAAAVWSQDIGKMELFLLVAKANFGANALYTSLGMRIVGHYHYRLK